MKTVSSSIGAILLAGTFLSGTPAAWADSRDDEIRQLRDQIQQLDQKLRVLERKQEIRDEEAASKANAAVKVSASDKGFTLASGDAANSLRLRALLQADSRWFFGDHVSNNDAFLLRRARLIFEGGFNKIYEYQLVPEFGGTSGNGTLTLLDANINVALKPGLQIRFGRFREPVGLEQLQSDSVAFFAERSIVSQFVPNRDVGVQVAGNVLNGTLSYAVGVFNGVADGANNANNSDTNDDKDVAARLFSHPFKNTEGALSGLGIGIAGSVGHQGSGAGATPALTSGYRTDAQQTWFSYRSTTVAAGGTWRLSPQAYYYYGPLGVMGEYVISSVEAANGTNRRTVRNKAWQLSAGYVLTGEDSGYKGVTPKSNFSLESGTWGAFEIVGRIGQGKIGDDAFAGGSLSLANPNAAAKKVSTYGVGLNWYLSRAVRASADVFHADFDYAAGAAPVRTSVIADDENALVTRLQLLF
ncbi:porin [Opitutaceae bacterium EW11]|nr:porin [Opitutaceae bacterium EW11]